MVIARTNPEQPETDDVRQILQQDMSLIDSRRSREQELSDRIRDFNATNDEIIEWYYGLDPLFERRAADGLQVEMGQHDISNISNLIEHDAKLFEAMLMGGAQIAHRALGNNVLLTPEETKALIISTSVDMGIEPEQEVDLYTANITLQHRIEQNTEYVVDKDTCEQLIIAADMLMMHTDLSESYRKYFVENAMKLEVESVENNMTPETVNRLFPDTARTSMLLYDVIAGLPDYLNHAITDEIRLLSVKACQRLSAQFMQEAMTTKEIAGGIKELGVEYADYYPVGYVLQTLKNMVGTSGFVDKYLSSVVDQPLSNVDISGIDDVAPLLLIDSIEKMYLGMDGDRSGLLYSSDTAIPKGTLKGELYEAVWQLDFMMLKLLHSKKVPFYRPAVNFEDRPMLGYPALLRGYDGKIKGLNGSTRWVQLKSSRSAAQKKGPPHPNIDTIAEDNFMDFEPRRLFSKLRLYKTMVMSHEHRDEGKMLKYVLPTVKEAFDVSTNQSEPLVYGESLTRFALNHLGYVPDPTTVNQYHPGVPRNRAERRASAKKQKRRK
jgi:hypothetical protein